MNMGVCFQLQLCIGLPPSLIPFCLVGLKFGLS